MAKKKTKLDKMSKKEKTSLAYALATNLAKHGKPQTPKNERKLTKGEMKKKEKEVKKFKKAFDLEEIQEIVNTIDEQKLDPVGKEDADINNDGKVDKTDDYLKNRRKAISKAIQKEGDLDLGHQDNEPHMLKKDLYRIAKYASELYLMVNNFDNIGMEVDFPHWWQSKIIKSKEMLISAKHYLDGELKIPQIDAMLGEEIKMNDPVLMKMRATMSADQQAEKAIDRIKKTAPKSDRKSLTKLKKLGFLNKERERLMRDMEQEAELEGGPIADRYGAELNRIDRAIAKLRE
tara:strand:+ start:456 stop:1325 length:870 start_codon:yes stop_codon:yes gene_type:complete